MGEARIPDDEEFRALLGEVGDALDELAVDGHGVLRNVTDWRFDIAPKPDPIELVHISDLGSVAGKRLVFARPAGGTKTNLRAASEVFEDNQGQWVRVVNEAAYFAWLAQPADQRPEFCPRSRVWSLENIWVDPTS